MTRGCRRVQSTIDIPNACITETASVTQCYRRDKRVREVATRVSWGHSVSAYAVSVSTGLNVRSRGQRGPSSKILSKIVLKHGTFSDVFTTLAASASCGPYDEATRTKRSHMSACIKLLEGLKRQVASAGSRAKA